MSAVSRRNTVFSPMKDFGSLFHPNPPTMSSKIRSFPQVEFAVYPLLSLNHKTVCLSFPFLNKN